MLSLIYPSVQLIGLTAFVLMGPLVAMMVAAMIMRQLWWFSFGRSD
jgi:hypothetical protein